ncbi:MAG: hypothetical protein K2L88_06705, partial [Clostridiales bacterium]|nr:hypothetical protein [Clostridiales bacterium]
MKEPIGSIIVKIVTLVAFVVCIIGGMYVMYYSYNDENWRLFIGGSCLLAFGFYLMGALCQLIMRYETHGSLDGLSLHDCLLSALIVMYFASSLFFFAISIMA